MLEPRAQWGTRQTRLLQAELSHSHGRDGNQSNWLLTGEKMECNCWLPRAGREIFRLQAGMTENFSDDVHIARELGATWANLKHILEV